MLMLIASVLQSGLPINTSGSERLLGKEDNSNLQTLLALQIQVIVTTAGAIAGGCLGEIQG